MKRLLIVLCLLFSSLPLFAFQQGDILIMGIGSAGLVSKSLISVGGKDGRGLGGEGSLNAELFIFDFLSLSAGAGLGARVTAAGMYVYNSDYTEKIPVNFLIEEWFFSFPVMGRFHFNVSEAASFYFGAGFQSNKIISAKYEEKNHDTQEQLKTGNVPKINEFLKVFEVGFIVGSDNGLAGISYRYAKGIKDKEIVIPSAMVEREFLEHYLSLTVGIKI